MIDDGDCGAIRGMKIGRGIPSTRRKPAPAPLRPPQIPHDQTRARNRAAAMENLSYGAALNKPWKTTKLNFGIEFSFVSVSDFILIMLRRYELFFFLSQSVSGLSGR
jgi:hypothetical protein